MDEAILENPATESGLSWSEYFRPDWLARHREEPVEPELPIIDPHHHLWAWLGYGLDAFLADATSGHNIRATVHLETGLARDAGDPEHLRAVGETRHLVALLADARFEEAGAPAICAGIVGHVDLELPEHLVEEALDAHVAAGQGRFKGVRLNAFHHDEVSWLDDARPGRAGDPVIRRNLAILGRRGLVCDVMAFHHQLREVAELAAASPEVIFVINHCGGFLGRIAKQGSMTAAMRVWGDGVRALADQGNVVMKLGGLACDFFSGIQLHLEPEPPTSQKIAEIYRPFFEPCINAFGAERCMFESNYPADRQQVDYVVLWNGFKRLAAGAGTAEKEALFSATARRIYSLTGV
jgi:predicted TIM-barrel fold metal-dependent hydrolase